MWSWPFTCLPTLRWRRHSSASRSACLIIWRICFSVKTASAGVSQSGIITFLPPLAFALFYPRGFVMALGYAGVALAVLALIMPALLVMKSRREHPQATWRVAGGAPTLWLVLLCGIGIVAIQFSIAAGLLPAVG